MDDLDGAGYAIAELVLTDQQCEHMVAALPAVAGGRAGVRNLVSHPTVLRLLSHAALGKFLQGLVGRELVAVNATLFDKTPEANWRAQWHQDRVIAVKERLQVAGYGPWSSKRGALHVEPPAEVLAQMLVVRVHLDASGAGNGPLRVIPGSHLEGKISEAELPAFVEAADAISELYLPQGGILLMRPLLVHSSSVAREIGHRRVLHLEFAPAESISPLQWQASVPLWRAA